MTEGEECVRCDCGCHCVVDACVSACLGLVSLLYRIIGLIDHSELGKRK